MVLGKPFRRNPHAESAHSLYLRVVAQARQPAFYADFGVPDTVDGRFDLVVLHVFLVLHRLKQDHPQASDLAQALFDTLFQDMDQSLRELGAGDMGVGPRIKRMIQGLYGRIAAYEAGLQGPVDELEGALRRNLYGTVTPVPASVAAVADYMRHESAALAQANLTALTTGELVFGPPPRLPAEAASGA